MFGFKKKIISTHRHSHGELKQNLIGAWARLDEVNVEILYEEDRLKSLRLERKLQKLSIALSSKYLDEWQKMASLLKKSQS